MEQKLFLPIFFSWYAYWKYSCFVLSGDTGDFLDLDVRHDYMLTYTIINFWLKWKFQNRALVHSTKDGQKKIMSSTMLKNTIHILTRTPRKEFLFTSKNLILKRRNDTDLLNFSYILSYPQKEFTATDNNLLIITTQGHNFDTYM